MTSRFIYGLIVSILLISVASAATELTVHTLPVHDVSVYILDPSPKYKSIDSFITRTGFDGLASKNVTISTTEFGIYVIVKKDGKTLFADRLENQATQGIVDVYVLVNESDKFMTPPKEDTASDNTLPVDLSPEETASGNESEKSLQVEENNTEPVVAPSENSGVTGKVINEPNAGITGNLVYIIAIAAVLGISLAGFLFMKQKQSNHPAFKSDDRPPTIFMADKELEEAERKIKYAQSQLALARETNAKRAEIQRKEELRKSIEAPKSSSFNSSNSIKSSTTQSNPGNSGTLASARPVLRPATTRPKLSGLVSDAKNTHEKIASEKAQSQNTQNNQDKSQGTSYSSPENIDKL